MAPMTSSAALQPAPYRAGALMALTCGYVALLPFRFDIGSSMNFAPADCLLVLSLVLAAGQFRYRRRAWTGWHLAIALLFAAGSLAAALRFGTLERYELVNKDLGLILPFLSYAAITSCAVRWQDVRRILRVFTWSVLIQNTAAVAAFLAAYFLGAANPFTRYGGLRLTGMLLDPNAYGGLLVMTLVIVEGSAWGPAPLFQARTLWFARLTLVPGILFTFSRSAWSAFGLALLLLCVVKFRVAARLMLAALIGAPAILLLMGRRFLPVFEVMASRPRQVEGRFELIHDGFAAFAQQPFLGGGIGSFRLSEGEIAHNSAMWFLSDFGIAGFAILLGFLGWFFVKGWSAYRMAPAAEQPVALAVLLAHTAMFGLAMGIEAFYQRHWWMAFALIASIQSPALRRIAGPPVRPGGSVA